MLGRSRVLRLSRRVYEALLLAYPREFRRVYAAHMAQAFGDLCREELARRGAGGVVALWARTLVDLLSTALAERTRMGTSLFSSPVLVRFGGLAAMVGGALGAVLALRIFLEPYGATSLSGTRVLGEALNMLGLVASLLITVGTLGLYACVPKGSRRLATMGLVLALVSTAAFAGTRLYESVVILSSGYPESAITPAAAIGIAGTADLVGYLLLGVAVLRARALGRWSALPLALSVLPLATPLLFLPFTVGSGGEMVGPEMLFDVFLVLPGLLGDLGWVLLGYLLWSGRSRDTEGQVRAA